MEREKEVTNEMKWRELQTEEEERRERREVKREKNSDFQKESLKESFAQEKAGGLLLWTNFEKKDPQEERESKWEEDEMMTSPQQSVRGEEREEGERVDEEVDDET
jgi:hypothetical protein